MVKLYYICVCLWLFSSCDGYDTKLIVLNKTDKTLVMDITEDSIYSLESSMNRYNLDLDDCTAFRKRVQIYPEQYSKQYGAFNTTWEWVIDRSYNKKLNLYVFEWDSLVKYRSLDSLYKVRGCYKKMTVSKAALEHNDWTVEIKD